jgi:cell division protein FtsQ
MSTGRKISVRKIIQTLVTMVVVTGCTMAMLSADRQQRNRKVRDVRLKIQSPAGVQFLTEDLVRNMLFTTRHVNPTKLALEKLDERSMEAILQSNPWVREAQVYTDAERIMHIHVMQRVPVVRLFEEDGNSYYLDAALAAMPLSSQYVHYTPVVTGVPHLRNDSLGRNIKGEIVGLLHQMAKQPFWRAQVSQIAMRPDGGYELIPVLGRQRIIIGDTGRLEEKLGNLFAFYKQVQNKVGWDRYTVLDLRYKGQVVASPALSWKVPVDRAISNMNWVNAIMESAPARQDHPGGDAAAFPDSAGTTAAPKRQAAGGASGTVVKPTSQPPARAALTPKSPAPDQLKLPPGGAGKKAGETAGKHTTSHAKNTKPHAATNR